MARNHPKPKTRTDVAYERGFSIRGERVVAQFRKMSRIAITKGSSTHKIQRTKLEGSVTCTIDRPLNYIRGTSPAVRQP